MKIRSVKKTLMALLLCSLSFALFSLISPTSAKAADLSDEEVELAKSTATESFKQKFGIKLFESIHAIRAKKVTDGCRIRLYYRDVTGGTSVEKVQDYFCHFHTSDHLDCHDL